MNNDPWKRKEKIREEELRKEKIKRDLEVENKQNELKNKIYDILEECGIELKVEGCGYCDSPKVTLKHKGDTILNEEPFYLSNVGEREFDDFYKKIAERDL